MSDSPNAGLLSTLTLGLLVYDKRDLVSVPATTTVDQALGIIQRENVLALPVTDASKPDEYVGIISIFDIMAYVAFGSFRVDETSDQFQLFRSAEIPVVDLLSVHNESERIWTLNDTDPIQSCLEPMSKGVHRIIVRQQRTSADGVVTTRSRLLTQSDLVRFLMSYSVHGRTPADGTPDARKSLSELHIVDSPNKPSMTAIARTATALEAFRLLEQHSIMSAPVVDEDGSIITSISASDLRGLRSHQLSSVLLPVLEFLKSQRAGALSVPITATLSSSLYDVSMLMILHRIHRVWIVDDAQKPIGVVSMSDVICKFSPFDYLV